MPVGLPPWGSKSTKYCKGKPDKGGAENSPRTITKQLPGHISEGMDPYTPGSWHQTPGNHGELTCLPHGGIIRLDKVKS